jgi:CheY-like chemotaxis protein
MTGRPQATQQQPLRVLVVDDDARVRAAITAELIAGGCEPTTTAPEHITRRSTAETTDNATDLTDAAPVDVSQVDVALVDVALPTVAAGLALIEALSATVPVVAISINGAARTAALSAGAVAYLEKDGDTDRLLHTLHTATRYADIRSTR